MAREGSSSNSRLLAIGAAVLVIGVILVLLILRGTIGNDDTSPGDAAEPTGMSTQPAGAAAQPAAQATPLTNEEILSSRLQLPLDIPEGMEAVAVRANFMRSVAAIPVPGDHVNLYRLPETVAASEAPTPEATTDTTTLPPPGPDAEQFLPDVEVLAVTGPTPAANDGVLTFVLAMAPDDVPSLMALAQDEELWFTLLPTPAAAATDAPTEG